MSADHARHPRLERHLARLLRYGTWLGSLVIAAGLVLAWVARSGASPAHLGTAIVTAGVAFFILLPVLRVGLMAGVFLRDRDYRFAVIATIVLAIIVSGAVLGTYLGGPDG